MGETPFPLFGGKVSTTPPRDVQFDAIHTKQHKNLYIDFFCLLLEGGRILLAARTFFLRALPSPFLGVIVGQMFFPDGASFFALRPRPGSFLRCYLFLFPRGPPPRSGLPFFV